MTKSSIKEKVNHLTKIMHFLIYHSKIICCLDVDEAENDNRRSMVADGRSDLSGNSRRPTIDSNMSRDKNASRELNIPPRGFTRKYLIHIYL